MSDMINYLPGQHDPAMVTASVLIAIFASYVTLNLARRMGSAEGSAARHWWIAGSLAMGTGIWAMHFVGMLAFSLPIALGYAKLPTLLSWVAAVAVSGVALRIAAGASLSWWRWVAGSLAMGAGICAMHYIGMAALDMSPGIVWDRWRVAASVLVAVVASAAALLIFFWLRRWGGEHGRQRKAAAALVMGLAISGMHYTGMSAASFPVGSICYSAASLADGNLHAFVMLASLGLLGVTLFTSRQDARLQGRTAQFAATLEVANQQLRSANEALQKQAFVDPLTALPNRLLFEDRLRHATARIARNGARAGERDAETLAVFFVDLDGFKPVNDSYGHAVGDGVLKETALRLLHTAREADTVARVGGDEFLLLIEGIAEPDDALQLARRLLGALAQPMAVEGRRVEITASIGIVLFPEHGQADKLVAHADAAMAAAKRAGGNNFALFEPRMDAGAAELLSLQNDLRHAVERQQLQLHYQPKIDGLTGDVANVEALLRWVHPERGMVSPAVFIPIAERYGLINAMGAWVIDEACRQIQAWSREGLHLGVAINLSVQQLRETDLVPRVAAALQRNGVEPAQLLCEITESVAMEDIALTLRAFEGLAHIGVFLSIDDFGTGYSSLSYLRKLPAQQLKIDRSFVGDLEGSSDAQAIVQAVISLAHALGLQVVAEGVETAGQRDILLAMHCDELQGYYFARPMPAAALYSWVLRHEPDVSIGRLGPAHPVARPVAAAV